MNTRTILISLLTAATLTACSSPSVLNLEDLGAQPTLEELNTDNEPGLELAGSTGGLGNLLVRKVYDTNQNGKFDEGEQGIPDWGVRIVSVNANGIPDDAADIQVTPQGSQRWRGVNLKVPFGRYNIQELEPTGTKQAGVAWKVTGNPSRIVNVSRSNPLRAIEFAGVCLENGTVVKFPKIANFGDWKCRATFNLLPRIANFSVLPTRISAGESSTVSWNVLDYAKVEITPMPGVVTGFIGSQSITPSSTTTYTIKATNGFGSSSLSSTVEVGAAGLWKTPTAFSNQILPSAGAVLARGPNDRAMLAFTSRSLTDSLYEDVVVNTFINPQGWTGFERIGRVVHNVRGETAYAKVSANGDAFVLVTSQGSRTVTAFRKPNGGAWNATPLELGILSGKFVSTPEISLDTDAAGNAFIVTPACAVLTNGFCSEYGTAVTRFSPQTGWSTPTLVGTKQAAISQTRIAVNASGEASLIIDVAAQGSTPGEIRYATFAPSTGWTSTKPLAVSEGTTSIGSLSLNIEASGNSNVVWKTSDALCISRFNSQSKDTGNCIIEPGSVSVGVGGNNILWVFSTTAFQSVIVRQYEPGRGALGLGWTQFETLPVTGKDATTPIDSFNAQILSVNATDTIFAALTVVYKSTNPFPESTTYALRRSTRFSLKQTSPILYLDPASTRANLLDLVTFSDGSALAVGTDVAASGRPQLLFNINR